MNVVAIGAANEKIAVLSDIFPPMSGGSGRWMYEVYRRFSPGTVTFIVGQQDECEVFDREHDDLDIHRVNLSLSDWGTVRPNACLKYLWLAQLVSRLTRNNQVSVVHAARVLPEGWVAYLLKLRRRLPYVVYVHGEDVCAASWSREHSWMVKRVLRNANLVVANSDNTARLLREDWNTPCQLLHPGVDSDYFVPASRELTIRKRLGWADRPTILTVGRLQKRKGHDQMIRAIDRLRLKFPDLLYAVCGDGDERESLHNLVAELGIADHVQFMGQVDEETLLSAYQQCDLFALPNREVDRDIEGFGMVLVEAQACGRPVLAGDSGGTRETMSVGSTGIIADCTCVATLTQVVEDLLRDPDQLEEMGRRGRPHVRERFDWGPLSNQAVRLFAQVIAAG